MGRGVLILGQSGTGKSTSIKSLDSDETFLINVYGKDMPFKGWKKKYTNISNGGDNMTVIDEAYRICKAINYAVDQGYKNIVIDDYQFVAGMKIIRDAKVKGYGKFNEIAQGFEQVATTIKNTPDHITVFILSHTEDDGQGGTKAKTAGKMIDSVIGLESLFTVVLQTAVDHARDIDSMRYCFMTQNNGRNTVKSPMGMFEDEEIPNDLQYVLQKIKEYDEE